MSELKKAISQLRETGIISLMDFKALKLADLEKLSDEIKDWCLYCNGNPEKFGKKHKEH